MYKLHFSLKGLILILIITFQCCTPKQIVTTNSKYPPLAESESFIVIDETDASDLSKVEIIGEFRIKDSGFSTNCEYESVVVLATKQAKQMGANGIKIYEHSQPDLKSNCHRIKAHALRLEKPSDFEKEIVWHQQRRLQQKDYKGPLENRPFQATTTSFIRYNYTKPAFASNVSLKIETVFDCRASYFKKSENAATVLSHEQGHFDLTELYARKFVKLIKEQVLDMKTLDLNHARLYRQIQDELTLEQDKYDSEVYKDPSKQAGWLKKIANDLENMEEYASKKIELPLGRKS